MGVIADMIRAGIDPEIIERVHDELVEASRTQQPVKTARQERNARYYEARKERLKASESVLVETLKTNQDVSDDDVSRAYKETTRAQTVIPAVSSLRSETDITPLPTEGPQGGVQTRKSEIVLILTECLSDQTADDLVAHRRSLKAPLTTGAARRLVKQLVASGDPEAAVSAMLVGGWKGFKPDWLKNQSARAHPPPRDNRNGFGQIAAELWGNELERASENPNQADGWLSLGCDGVEGNGGGDDRLDSRNNGFVFDADPVGRLPRTG